MDASAVLRETIVENLRTRQWRAGHRIPTERAFSVEFGLSRSTVRRVLQEFKRQGLITQTVGSGTYVSAQAYTALALLHPRAGIAEVQTVSPAELMAARMVLEPALIELVVGNAGSADFARMDDCNVQAEAATTLEDFEHWDGQLHQALAEAAHNVFIASVYRLMNDVRTQSEWGTLKRRSLTPERRLQYQQQHREMVAAVKDRNAERARALCLAHLVQVRTNMLSS